MLRNNCVLNVEKTNASVMKGKNIMKINIVSFFQIFFFTIKYEILKNYTFKKKLIKKADELLIFQTIIKLKNLISLIQKYLITLNFKMHSKSLVANKFKI